MPMHGRTRSPRLNVHDCGYVISDGLEICHSPERDGWYLQRSSDHKTSQIFPSREAAIRAIEALNAIQPPSCPLIDWS